MMKITHREEERSCLFCKRKEIETRKMSLVDKNGKIIVSMSACFACLKQMREELERKLEETENEIQQYREIGTVEECREAKERQRAKKPNIWGDGYDDEGNIIYDMYDCPNCGKSYEIDYEEYNHCPNCGQKIDRSDFD